MNKTKTKINTKVTSKTQDEKNQPYNKKKLLR